MLEYKAFGNHNVKVVLMSLLFLDLGTIVSSHCSPMFMMVTLQEVEEPKKVGLLGIKAVMFTGFLCLWLMIVSGTNTFYLCLNKET